MTTDATPTDEGDATRPGPDATHAADDATQREHDAVPHLEVDESVPPRPEEEIADAVRGTDSTPAGPGSV